MIHKDTHNISKKQIFCVLSFIFVVPVKTEEENKPHIFFLWTGWLCPGGSYVACAVFYDIEKESRVDSLSVNLTFEVPGGFEPP